MWDFLAKIINMNLIFDIGANKGLFTDKCLELNPNVKVVLVEPNPQLYNFLKNKYKPNPSIIVLDSLVSEKSNEYIDFFLSNADTISTASKEWINSSRFTKHYFWNNSIKKLSTNLDELVNSYGIPDLIKIDVEGYEYEVIKGLSKKIKEICFEWAEEQYVNINKTCDYLINLGYTEFGYIEGDEYLKKPDLFCEWSNLEIHNNIDIDRKEKWGMIWVK